MEQRSRGLRAFVWKSWHYHYFAMWPGANYLTFLILILLNGKIQRSCLLYSIIESIKWSHRCEALFKGKALLKLFWGILLISQKLKHCYSCLQYFCPVEHHLASNIQRNRLVQHDLQVAKQLQEEDLKAQAQLQKRYKDLWGFGGGRDSRWDWFSLWSSRAGKRLRVCPSPAFHYSIINPVVAIL